MNEIAMEEELQLLAKCSISEVPKILNFIVDKMCGRKPTVNYSEFHQTWTLQEWWQIIEQYTNALKDVVKNKWSKDDMEKMFQHLPRDYKLAIQDCVNSRHDEIIQILLNETCSVSSFGLVDFDWQLKLVIGSGKMGNFRQPIASILLNTDSEENIVLEMNKEELAKFITTLEQANRAVSQLQT